MTSAPMTGGSYEVTCPKLEEQIAKINASPTVIHREITTAMGSAVQYVESRVKAFASEIVGVTGNYAAGWANEVSSEDVTSVVGRVYSTIKSVYPAVIEFGRRPGARRPPVSALIEWVVSKWGAENENEARSKAFILARSIGRKGIKARPILLKAWNAAKGNVTQAFDRAIQRITESMVVK